MPEIRSQQVLGFDFGLKRIGVAVGQTLTKTAKPLVTLQAQDGTPRWEDVAKLIAEWQPDILVVGIPLNMDGTSQPLTDFAKRFANALELHYHLPVYGMDERLSTVDARERLFESGGYRAIKSGIVDQVAAQLILESWMREQR